MTPKPICPDFLSIAVNAVADTPACWTGDQLRAEGWKDDNHVCPDHAIFDLWIETPGSGWYQMCQEADTYGYDGVHAALAVELDTCWLSWDQSPNSLQARLTEDAS